MDEKESLQLPEAPASATVKVKSKNEFEWMFTMRDESVSELMKKIELMEDKWIKAGWTPLPQNYGGKPGYAKKAIEYIEGRKCPICQGRLVKPQNPRAPIKCENNIYDFKTKTNSGCAFQEWPKPNSDEIPERQIEDY